MTDNRNVTDEFKDQPHEEIVAELDSRGVDFEIAIENTLRDYNMGTIVRTANAFGVRRVHVVGRRQWNKRGAMMTDKYLEVVYHASIGEFQKVMLGEKRQIVTIENNVDSIPLAQFSTQFSGQTTVLVFGQEGTGLSTEFLAASDQVVHIEQLGSTRSLNVGVAAGVAMYQMLSLTKKP